MPLVYLLSIYQRPPESTLLNVGHLLLGIETDESLISPEVLDQGIGEIFAVPMDDCVEVVVCPGGQVPAAGRMGLGVARAAADH
jgi:hypothetical protein